MTWLPLPGFLTKSRAARKNMTRPSRVRRYSPSPPRRCIRRCPPARQSPSLASRKRQRPEVVHWQMSDSSPSGLRRFSDQANPRQDFPRTSALKLATQIDIVNVRIFLIIRSPHPWRRPFCREKHARRQNVEPRQKGDAAPCVNGRARLPPRRWSLPHAATHSPSSAQEQEMDQRLTKKPGARLPPLPAKEFCRDAATKEMTINHAAATAYELCRQKELPRQATADVTTLLTSVRPYPANDSTPTDDREEQMAE